MSGEAVFTGRHMLLAMGGFFGVVIAVNVGIAVLSSGTWTGLVVENSYVASQEYQEKLDAHYAQQALGWTAHFEYAGGRAELILTDRDGKPVALGGPTLQLSRPIGTKHDATLTLAPLPGEAGYGADIDLAPGAWDAIVTGVTDGAGPFELHQRFVVPGA